LQPLINEEKDIDMVKTGLKSHRSVFIRSINQLSVQKPLTDEWFDKPVFYSERRASTIDPDFSKHFPPLVARRMCKLLKRAVMMSRLTLKEAAVEMPDAIISGTGLGCIDNTEHFLHSIIENGEHLLQPTYFMQSTHNILSSTIAIDLKCHGYNNTYVHRGVSFDNALADAVMQLNQGKINTALVGAYEEMTDNYFTFFDRIGLWDFDSVASSDSDDSINAINAIKSVDSVNSIDAIDSVNSIHSSESVNSANSANSVPLIPFGCFSSEASMNMLLTSERDDSAICEITDFDLIYTPSLDGLRHSLDALLERAGCSLDDIDAVLTGLNTHPANDAVYRDAILHLFATKPILCYKHIFGESFASSAMGFYAAVTCLRRGSIPSFMFAPEYASPDLSTETKARPVRRILIHNHFLNKSHSFILLSSCSN
jgi:3-oxoacyl-(acyl-carrier-protein) synthase